MTLHFVYAVPPVNSRILAGMEKLRSKMKIFPPLHRNGDHRFISWPKPVHAPYSITYYLLNALKKKYHVKLYDLREKVSLKAKRHDIILAHLFPDFSNTPWKNADTSLVGYKAIMENRNNKAIIISPYNHDIKQIGWLQQVFKERKDLLFVPICGEYWMKDWDQSPLKELIPSERILRVNMAIDSSQYPFIKTSFSPKYKRKYLYIGRTDYPKNIKALEDIAAKYKGFEGGYICTGSITGWNKISEFSQITPELAIKLTREYDFFLSTSEADAQATTVLESMSLGMGLACTPESGYDYSSIIPLDKNNVDFNCRQIEKMQTLEESEILAMTRMNRKIVEEKHSWKKFSEDIIRFIEK